MKKIIVVFTFFLAFSFNSSAQQPSDKYHFKKVTMADIDSLVSDSMVINEFKIINYCYCLNHLKIEGIKADNKNRTDKYKIPFPNPYNVDYAYFGGGHPFSSHLYESGKSFFMYNYVDKVDFEKIIKNYYDPIIMYIKNTNDMRLLSGYSPMFECFYAVEKMPLQIELKKLLIKRQSELRFFIID